MSLLAHPDRPFDLDDLLDAPDDGYRYEVIDGALVVNAAPSWRHQQISLRLARVLEDAAPAGVVVLPAPVWRIGPGQLPEPDIVVVEQAGLGEIAVERVPLLVVEILSPSNRGSDLVRKRALYAEAGCPIYWIVEPTGPVLTMLDLDGDAYVETGRFERDDAVMIDRPYPVHFDLSRL